MDFENHKKLSCIWEYPIERITSNTEEDIKITVSYRERLLKKVENDEWYLNEYNDFVKVLKKSTIKKFVEFIDIANLVFEMSREDIGNEVGYLISTGFLKKEKDNKFSTYYIAQLIFEIQARIFSLSNQFSTNISSIEEKSEYYRNLIMDIENEDSDYHKFVCDVYESWIEQTFKNEELKNILLSQRSIFIKKVKKNINQRLSVLDLQIYNSSAMVNYEVQQKGKKYDKKAMAKKCWSYYKRN